MVFQGFKTIWTLVQLFSKNSDLVGFLIIKIKNIINISKKKSNENCEYIYTD